MTIRECIDDAYLTDGVPPQHVDEVRALRVHSTGSSKAHPAVPAAMSPLTLHTQPPLVLPVANVRDGADLVDQQWSRRQFSVLWAPMPADYQFEGEAAQKVSVCFRANVFSIGLDLISYCFRLVRAAARRMWPACGS